MVKLCRSLLRSTKTVIGIFCLIVLGELAKIAGDYGRIRYEEVGLVPFLQEINSWRVSARIVYPEAYFGFLAFLAVLLAMALYVRIAERRAQLPTDG